MEQHEVPLHLRRVLFSVSVLYAVLTLPLVVVGILWDSVYRSEDGNLFYVFNASDPDRSVERVEQLPLIWPGVLIILQVVLAIKVKLTPILLWVIIHLLFLLLSVVGVSLGTIISSDLWTRMKSFEDLESCVRVPSYCICRFWNDRTKFAKFNEGDCHSILPWYELLSVYFPFSCLCGAFCCMSLVVSFIAFIKLQRKGRPPIFTTAEESPARICNVAIIQPLRTPPSYSRIFGKTTYGALSYEDSRNLGRPPPYETLQSD